MDAYKHGSDVTHTKNHELESVRDGSNATQAGDVQFLVDPV